MKLTGNLIIKMLEVLEPKKYEESDPSIAIQYSMVCETLRQALTRIQDLIFNDCMAIKFNEYKEELKKLIYKYSVKDAQTLSSVLDNNGEVCIYDPIAFRKDCVGLYNQYKPYIEQYLDKYGAFMSHPMDVDIDLHFIKDKDIIRRLLVCNRRNTPYKLSEKSSRILFTCHKPLIDVFKEVLFYKDISILEGYRGEQAQEEAKNKGNSKASFGESAHNYKPSLAVDVVPYPIPTKEVDGVKVWDDESPEWEELHEIVQEICLQFGVKLTWGGDFTSFKDKPHYELTEWRKLVNCGN